jgi:hypothetical protein
LESDSLGSFFQRYIKGNYHGVSVEQDAVFVGKPTDEPAGPLYDFLLTFTHQMTSDMVVKAKSLEEAVAKAEADGSIKVTKAEVKFV